MSNENHSAHSDGHHGHFVVPAAAYVAVFIALLILTVVTVAVAQVDLGPANMPVAMLVATMKASLVALIFMQLKYDDKLNGLVFIFGLIFLSLFFLFTLLDVFSREYIDTKYGNHTIAAEQLRAMQNKAADKAGVNTPVKPGGYTTDMPTKDEWQPPPPPPTTPDAGLADGGVPAEGSEAGAAPGSEPGAAPGSEAAPSSAAPGSAAPESAAR